MVLACARARSRTNAWEWSGARMNAAIRDSKELRCGRIVIAVDAPEKCSSPRSRNYDRTPVAAPIFHRMLFLLLMRPATPCKAILMDVNRCRWILNAYIGRRIVDVTTENNFVKLFSRLFSPLDSRWRFINFEIAIPISRCFRFLFGPRITGLSRGRPGSRFVDVLRSL